MLLSRGRDKKVPPSQEEGGQLGIHVEDTSFIGDIDAYERVP